MSGISHALSSHTGPREERDAYGRTPRETVRWLKAKGWSSAGIARHMGVPLSFVTLVLAEGKEGARR